LANQVRDYEPVFNGGISGALVVLADALTDCERERDRIRIEDVIEWADGILGALGTEHSHKVTDREAVIATAIINTSTADRETAKNKGE